MVAANPFVIHRGGRFFMEGMTTLGTRGPALMRRLSGADTR